MNTTISAKKMQIPQNFKEYAEERIDSRLGKFFGEDAEAKIVLSEMKNQIVLELTVKYNSIIFRSERNAEDKFVALDDAIDKIIRQIRKNKTKVEKKLKEYKYNKSEHSQKIADETKFIYGTTPCFPYGNPRDYQQQAFINWKNNKQKGLFAMATGTGKTLTSLNCLLRIYKVYNFYKAVILVPTITLVDQWEQECKKFHFSIYINTLFIIGSIFFFMEIINRWIIFVFNWI